MPGFGKSENVVDSGPRPRSGTGRFPALGRCVGGIGGEDLGDIITFADISKRSWNL